MIADFVILQIVKKMKNNNFFSKKRKFFASAFTSAFAVSWRKFQVLLRTYFLQCYQRSLIWLDSPFLNNCQRGATRLLFDWKSLKIHIIFTANNKDMSGFRSKYSIFFNKNMNCLHLGVIH